MSESLLWPYTVVAKTQHVKPASNTDTGYRGMKIFFRQKYISNIYQQTLKISFPTSHLEGVVKISKDDYSDEYSDLLEKYNDFICISQTGKTV